MQARMVWKRRMWGRWLLAPVAIGLLALVAAACGGGDDPTPTTGAPTATSPAPTATSPLAPGETRVPPTPTPTTPPIPAWQLDWDQTVEAAKEEGLVVVAVTRAAYRTGLETVLMEEYPDIQVEAQVGQGSEQRSIIEYGAGIHSVDIGFGGASTADASLLPAGILGDTRAQLIRPDVIDDEHWIGRFDDYWCDDLDGRKHIFCFWATPSAVRAFLNTNLTDQATFTLDDLFRPENEGRWCLYDPRTSGAGRAWLTEVLMNKGADYIRQLMETSPTLSTNGRAMAEDIIRGEFIFCAGVTEVLDFHALGLGQYVTSIALNLHDIAPEFAGQFRSTCCGDGRGQTRFDGQFTAGIGGPYMYLEPPNPNAAKVLLNLLGTRQGARNYLEGTQQVTRHCSGRVDLQDICPFENKLEDGKAYIDFIRGSTLPLRDLANDITIEVYGGR